VISELFLFSNALTKGATAPIRTQSAHFGAKSPFIPPMFAIPRRRLNSYENFNDQKVSAVALPMSCSGLFFYFFFC
jgi:hypothetical protein